MTPLVKDWLERAVWLAAFSVIGVLVEQVANLNMWWAPVIMLGLQQARNVVTRRIGDSTSVGVTTAGR